MTSLDSNYTSPKKTSLLSLASQRKIPAVPRSLKVCKLKLLFFKMVGSFLPNVLTCHISLSLFKQCIFIAHRSVTRSSYCLRQKRRGKKTSLQVFRRFRKIAKNVNQIHHVRPAVSLSVSRSAWNNSALTARISIKFDISIFFEHLSRRFKFH